MSQSEDAAKVQSLDPSVNFLYKTMLQRDPRKRRVKLVQKHLVQVDFDLGDSEEDSDFDIGQHHDSDSLSEIDEDEKAEMLDLGAAQAGKNEVVSVENSDDETNDAAQDTDGEEDDDDEDDEDEDGDDEEDDDSDDDDDEEEEDEESDDEDSEDEDTADVRSAKPREQGLDGILGGMDTSDEEDEDYVPQKKKKKKNGVAKTGNIKMKSPEPPSKPQPASHTLTATDQGQGQGGGQGRIKVLICCVCLSDQSADDDEIVECDNCGISVHEGCYGISESHSTASTVSSASTEPWFCDACKAGVSPHCELCPNSGGIYKETDAGKWVHLVCALYTPGVAFGDVDRLCPVTLFEMSYSKWGAKECSLCEDVRFSRTGVCISCDAGMCRTFFHVTCAQREGLLTEAAPEEVMDIADPFFAYCKQHADKMTVKARRRHWLAIQSHARFYSPKVMDDAKEQARFQRKLSRHREKYVIARNKRPPSWVPTQKMVRHLHTSPYAVKAFMRKAELMGVVTHVENAHHEKPEARKKPHITPGLSSEFIQYYFGRNTKIDNLRNNLKELTMQNGKLQEQEKVLRRQYEQLSRDLDKLRESSGKYRREGEHLWNMLADMSKKNITVPEIFRPRKRQRSPSKKETPCSPPALIQQCGICQKTTDQHLLAKCDSCRQHYHLGCLDPPLTRMPKKTKLMGWQCSQCVSSSSDDSDGSGARLVDEPRRLRETIKEPVKFRHMQSVEFKAKLANKSHKKKKIKKKAPQTNSTGTSSASDTKSVVKISPEQKKRAEKMRQREKTHKATGTMSHQNPVVRLKKEDEATMCVVCNKAGDGTNTVRCDECMLSYHFHCLDPPVKKSPKVRGYTWHCEACDPTDLSEEEEMEEEQGGDNSASSKVTTATGTTFTVNTATVTSASKNC